MYKKLWLMLLSCLLVAILAAPVMADSGLITGSVVNVRSGPGIDYQVVGSLYKDTRVEILAANNGWNKIKYGSLTGWVSQSLINIDKVDTRLQVIEGTVNLRSGPGTSYSRVGQVVKGDVLILTGTEGQWYKVKTPAGTEAYVRSDLVAKLNGEEANNAQTSPGQSPGKTDTNLDISVYLDNNKLSFEDVKPIVEKERVLVPLRAIFEAMGAEVEWQQDLSRAVATKGDTTVVLPLNSIHPTINGIQQTIDVPAKVINERILAPLRFVGEAFGGEVTWDQANLTVRIKSAKDTPPPPPPVELPTVRLYSSREASGVKIYMEAIEPLKSEKDSSGNNLTYIFEGYKLEGAANIQQAGGITAQASTQGEKVTVRINIPDGLEYNTYTELNGKRIVVSIPNSIISVKRSTFGNGGEKIDVNALASFTYTAEQDNSQMVIELKGIKPGKAQASYSFNSKLIEKVTFASSKKNPDNTLLTIKTKEPAKFTWGSNSDGTTLYILFIAKSALQSREPIVVLDPGHGGKDPGARGYAIEKEVNLAIALKAGEFLKQNGIKVEFTRKDDSFLELNEISDIANLYNAAVFVSIHNNSSTSSSASGTETYYYAPISRPDLYIQKDERYSLAVKIQKHVVNAINLPDRGVKTANFAVLRNTQMPSALVEVAFVSNPNEGTLLTQPDFQDKAGTAIGQAIMEYMREHVNIQAAAEE